MKTDYYKIYRTTKNHADEFAAHVCMTEMRVEGQRFSVLGFGVEWHRRNQCGDGIWQTDSLPDGVDFAIDAVGNFDRQCGSYSFERDADRIVFLRNLSRALSACGYEHVETIEG